MQNNNIKKYMIYLENGMVSVIRHKGDKIEFIKKDGEIEFPITIDFWIWWKRAVSFLSNDEADFCFIYDKDYDLLHDDLLGKIKQVSAEESIWNVGYIKNFFWELKPTYFTVCLIGTDGKEYCLNGNKPKGITQKRFYTNLLFVTNEPIAPKDDEGEVNEVSNIVEDSIDTADISPIAKYFVDLIRKERGYE